MNSTTTSKATKIKQWRTPTIKSIHYNDIQKLISISACSKFDECGKHFAR